jgi:hypothetical protein
MVAEVVEVVAGGLSLSVTGFGSWITRHRRKTWYDFIFIFYQSWTGTDLEEMLY